MEIPGNIDGEADMRFLSLARLSTLLLIFVIPFMISGCGGDREEASKPAEVAAEAPSQPDSDIVRTRKDPGAYGGKEDSHVPRIEWKKTDAGLSVTVSVDHEMNPETPHYIMWIGLWDESGRLIGEKTFSAEDEAAVAVFELNRTPSGFKAYEKCNLHGVWMEERDIRIPIEKHP